MIVVKHPPPPLFKNAGDPRGRGVGVALLPVQKETKLFGRSPIQRVMGILSEKLEIHPFAHQLLD